MNIGGTMGVQGGIMAMEYFRDVMVISMNGESSNNMGYCDV